MITFGLLAVVAALVLAPLSLATPAHAEDAPGPYVIQDELSCLSFGAESIEIEVELGYDYTTSWDEGSRTCYNVDDHQFSNFDLPDQKFPPGGEQKIRYDTVEIAPGVTLESRGENLVMNSGATLINRGTIKVISNTGDLVLNGHIINYGTFTIGNEEWHNGGGQVTNYGTINSAAEYNNCGETYNYGVFNNQGFIHNCGRFDNGAPGIDPPTAWFNNEGRFDNHREIPFNPIATGTFNNYAIIINTNTIDLSQNTIDFYSGSFDNRAGTIIANSADPIRFLAATIDTPVSLYKVGTVNVIADPVISSSGSINIFAGTQFTILSGTTISNHNEINNLGGTIRVDPDGAIVNTGVILNEPLDESGSQINLFIDSFVDNAGGTIMNAGTMFVGGATISNTGTFANSGTINSVCSTITGNPVSGVMPNFTPCAPEITSFVLEPDPLNPNPPRLDDFAPFTPGLYGTNTPTITGTSNVLSGGGSPLTITLFVRDPVTGEEAELGSTTTSSGDWFIASSPLPYGLHEIFATATNSQGNSPEIPTNALIGITMLELKDEPSCESINGIWDSGTDTCTTHVIYENDRTDNVLKVDADVELVFAGLGTSKGIINNHGAFTNVGDFTNEGAFNNHGILSSIGDPSGGIPFFDEGGFVNSGVLSNEAGAVLALENFANFINAGTVNNRGTIEITDSIFEMSVIEVATLNNYATINNQGTLDNTNGGAIFMFCGATINGNPVLGSAPIELPCPPVITSSGLFGTTTPTITGTSQPGVTVNLFVLSGGLLTPIGSTTASPAGTWSITTVPLSTGTHTLVAQASNSAGISELSDPRDIIIDNIPPTVIGTADRAPDSIGWYNHEVTITWSGTDASGIAFCDPPTVYSGPDGSSITLTGQCTDNAGNVGEGTVTISYDATPPTITGMLDRAFPVSGWYRTDVTAQFTASDATSGIKAFSNAIELDSEGAGQSAEGFAEDHAGNIAFFTIDGINIDKTAPEITFTRTPANENGWNNGDVTVHFEATDSLSGVQGDSFFDVFFTLEGAGQTTGLVTFIDVAGNIATEEVSDINIDKTPPEVTGNPTESLNENGWYNHDVTIEFSATDSLSGIDGPDTATETISEEGDSQSASHTFTDLAGNSATGTVSGIKLDKTAPELTIPDDIADVFPTSPDGAAVGFEAQATDNLDPSPIIEYSIEPGTTFPIGTTTVQVTATDHAGNSVTDSFTVTVLAPEEATEELAEIVQDMGLPQDIEDGLTDKLEAAASSIENGRDRPAQNQLRAFINQVNAQTGKSITEEQAQILIEAARNIINSIS
jgi:hypothetical protein